MDTPDVSSSPVEDLGGYVPFQDYSPGVQSEIESPPLPADPAPDAGAAPQEPTPDQPAPAGAAENVTADPATQAAQPSPEGAAADDPDLTPEQNTYVKSLPEAEQAAATRTLKAARFEDHFTSPGKPKSEVADYLEKRFPTDFREFSREVVRRQMSDMDAFCRDLFGRDKELYGRLALTAFQNDPDRFLQLGTGRDGLTFEAVKAALEGGPAAGSAVDASALTEEDWEDLQRWDEGLHDKLKASLSAPKPAEQAAADTPGGGSNAPQSLPPDEVVRRYEAVREAEAENFEYGLQPVVEYVGRKVDSKFGAAPTAEEMKSAPLVARLKAIKRDYFLNGGKEVGLPSFRDGLAQWGRERQLHGRKFDESLNRFGRFVTLGERDNARGASGELTPFADAYFDERARDPLFSLLDRAIELALAGANPPTPNEHFTPGSAAGSQQRPAEDPQTRFSNLAYENV